MAKRREDIPRRDDDFYTFIKDIIEILEEAVEKATPEPGGAVALKWEAWEIPERDFKKFKSLFATYQELYLRAQKKKDRTGAQVTAHRTHRDKTMEPFLRQFIREHLRHESIIPEEEKIRMGLITKDEEPSPVHGTHLTMGTPDVKLRNLEGGRIDAQFRRTSDQTRPSVPNGYGCELRYALDTPLPDDPDDIPSKTTVVSSKAHFQIEAGITNIKKTMRSWARWKHKTNAALHSAWVKVMEITVA